MKIWYMFWCIEGHKRDLKTEFVMRDICLNIMWRRHRWDADLQIYKFFVQHHFGAGRDLYRATHAVTRDLVFYDLIFTTAQIKWPLTTHKGYWVVILISVPSGIPMD